MSLSRRFVRCVLPVAALLVAVVVAGCSSQRRCRPCNDDWAAYGEIIRGSGDLPCSPCGTDWGLYGEVLAGDMPCQDCPRTPACHPCRPDCPPCIPCPKGQANVGPYPGRR